MQAHAPASHYDDRRKIANDILTGSITSNAANYMEQILSSRHRGMR